jgi:hypothetical protein
MAQQTQQVLQKSAKAHSANWGLRARSGGQ